MTGIFPVIVRNELRGEVQRKEMHHNTGLTRHTVSACLPNSQDTLAAQQSSKAKARDLEAQIGKSHALAQPHLPIHCTLSVESH